MLALQAPMASDLRQIVTAVKMIGEIERSADLAVNICKAARRIYGIDLDPKLRGMIAQMGEQAGLLFRLSIDAYKEGDVGARRPRSTTSTTSSIGCRSTSSHRSSSATQRTSIELHVAVQLALVARFYERIGDHAVNIGERVRYMVTGWLPEPRPRSGRLRLRRRSTRAR